MRARLRHRQFAGLPEQDKLLQPGKEPDEDGGDQGLQGGGQARAGGARLRPRGVVQVGDPGR
ncbi:MAG: hypothetical protein IT555_20835 [Acetobacteraceae bacterium]|nr:hypothetical protein [Acetobacteraceae bacterium]